MKIVDAAHPTVRFTPVSKRRVGAMEFSLKSARTFPPHRYVRKTNVRLVVPHEASWQRPAVLTLFYSVPRYASTQEMEPWLSVAMEQLREDYESAARKIAEQEVGEILGSSDLQVESSLVEVA